MYNLWDGHRARESEEAILAEYLQENKKASESPDASDKEDKQNIPDYILNPDMDMPEYTLKSLGDVACIGILEIPALDLELPVISSWSYSSLRLAPCRYSGSAYKGDLVIAAHNYQSHFGGLRTLPEGSEVFFTDAVGNRFSYYVAVTEGTDSLECGRYDERRVAAHPVYPAPWTARTGSPCVANTARQWKTGTGMRIGELLA